MTAAQAANSNGAPSVTKPKTFGRSIADVARGMSKQGPIVRLATGIPSVDTAMRGGIAVPRFVVVGGAPGVGKTSLAIYLAFLWACRGVWVGILAIDEGPEGVVMRIAQMLGFSVSALEEGDAELWELLLERLAKLPILIVDGDDDEATVENVARALSVLAKGAPSVLVVDSVQTVRAVGSEKADGIRARIDIVVRALKRVPQRYLMMVIATCELARGSYRSKQAAEQINDLAAFKESGSIEYAGQTLFVLRSVPGEESLIDVAVPKNRAHRKQPFRLRMDHRLVTFEEVLMPDTDAKGNDVGTDLDEDVQAVVRVLLEAPGVAGHRGVRAELKARKIAMSHDRLDAAIAKLGKQVDRRKDGRSVGWFFVAETTESEATPCKD